MKIPFSIKLPAYLFSGLLLVAVACDKDGGDTPPEPTFANPTIAITEPTTAENTVEIGQTVNVKLAVAAEAGLKEVRANDASVKTYGGTEVSDNVTFQVAPTAAGSFTVTFVVKDTKDKTATVEFKYTAVEPAEPPFVIASLTGELLGTDTHEVASWDTRTVYRFGNTSDLDSDEVTIEFVAENGDADAATVDGSKVLSITPHAAKWGSHYVYGMINLGTTIPEEQLQEIPKMVMGTADTNNDGVADRTTVVTSTGYKKVIQVDAYYNGTVTDTVSIVAMKQLQKIWGLDLTKGYQIDLLLAKSDPHRNVDGGEIKGMYAGYSAWITEANKWQTLTFDFASEGVARWLNDGEGSNDETRNNPAAIDEVDVVTIVPSFAQTIYDLDPDKTIRKAIDGDYNKLYFKNLRIVKVAE